jgi:hypothetical protein
MSGGGGGGGDGGFGPPDGGTDCQRLRFIATLQSPQAQAVAAISVGELLDVVLDAGSGSTPPIVEVRRTDGTTVGALIEHLTELLRCLREGVTYIAEVRDISGGSVRVQVRPR